MAALPKTVTKPLDKIVKIRKLLQLAGRARMGRAASATYGGCTQWIRPARPPMKPLRPRMLVFDPARAEELKAAVLAKLTYTVGKDPVAAQPARLVPRGRPRDARHRRRTLDQVDQPHLSRTIRKRVYYLQPRIPGRPHAVRRDDQPRHRRADDRRAVAARRRSQRAAAHRIRRRARQRRPRPARRLLHGQHGDAVDRGARLRHPLRQRLCSARSSAAAGSRRSPKDWLSHGNPWEFERPEVNLRHRLRRLCRGGARRRRLHAPRLAPRRDASKRSPSTRRSSAGRGRHVNTLRLWSARAPDPIKLDAFNAGDYIGALSDTVRAEAISKVLYPSDATPAGQELRLRQEYFFASASLLDLVRRHVKQHRDIRTLGEHVAVQLNDTHPSIGVAELMRILVDMNRLEWDEAWEITQAVFSYTNHTLLPEALESWPVPLMERLLPRHMQIIYLINAAHLDGARKRGLVDPGLLASISLIDEHGGRRVRMGSLAFIGSHKINGVSALHTNSDARDRVPRPQCGLPRPHRQQDQRHHVSPLADRMQPGPDHASSTRRSAKRRCTIPRR